jgi:aryl-alcohol dehydrogenase-like predicted oxidoreductase
MVKGFLRDEVLERVELLRPIAEQVGLTMAQLAVAWVLQNDNVASAIVGASRPGQITDNVGAVGVRLDAEVLAAIDDAVAPVMRDDPSLTRSPETRP